MAHHVIGVTLAMQVTEETSNMRFNTGISAMMEFINGAYKWDERPRAALEHFVLLLSPYAPHLAEEMWQVIDIEVCIVMFCRVTCLSDVLLLLSSRLVR